MDEGDSEDNGELKLQSVTLVLVKNKQKSK